MAQIRFADNLAERRERKSLVAYIKVEKLKYAYPNTEKLALDNLNFEIEKGSFVGIIGRNGAGKSTLCQAFVGLVPNFFKGAYGGKVWIDKKEVAKEPISELCRQVGLVFQNPFNQLSGAKDTIFEEVAFGLQNFGVPKEEMIARVKQVLKLLDIEAYRERNPFDLSGGQMQRVAIASILAMEPDVLVLDEPTSQLDPAGSEEVFRAVWKLKKSGITIIMVEQKIEKLAEYCDRILLLDNGKQVAFDTPERIFSMENLEQYGVTAPVYTKICREFDIRLENGCYPASLKETLQQKERFPKELPEKEESKRQKKERESAEIEQSDRTNSDQKTVFRVENLHFYYRIHTPVLPELSLKLDSRSTAIIGQNGAGKTTFVKLLKGLLKPVQGSIFYGDENIAGKTVAMLAGEIGYVFQNPDDQIFKYHVMDEVMFGPLNIGMKKETAQKKALEALRMVGLENLAEENPYDLELSQRKLIAIASVIAMDTKVLILDEPTIAQDRYGKRMIGDVIQKLKEERRLVIAILHDMDFVAENFERVIVMAHGRVLADGRKEEVFAQEDVMREACIEPPYLTTLCRKMGYTGMYFQIEELKKRVILPEKT